MGMNNRTNMNNNMNNMNNRNNNMNNRGCFDFPHWLDSNHHSCRTYDGCNDVEYWAVNGISARDACCQCGGGIKNQESINNNNNRNNNDGNNRNNNDGNNRNNDDGNNR